MIINFNRISADHTVPGTNQIMSTAGPRPRARDVKDSETSEMPVDNPEPEKEEERTLTDHLNKKLLKSFLSRMDAGTTGFKLPPQQAQEPENKEDGFD